MTKQILEAMTSEVRKLLLQVVAWAESETGLCAVALVGSQARGEAKPSSDIDLVLLTMEPGHYVNDHAWISEFGEPLQIEEEQWGNVTSLRVFYRHGLEVEFGITGTEWASDPTDPGVAQVIADGIVVMYESEGQLSERIGGIFSQ